MSKLVYNQNSFHAKLELVGVKNGKPIWRVMEEMYAVWQGRVIRVPIGFLTDLASIPSFVPNWIIPKLGRQNVPAVFHDFCYSGETELTRKQADDMFLEGMGMCGVWWWRRQLMYAGVRLGGASRWQGIT